MAAPNTFENFYRVHDTALMNWLRTCLIDYGDGGKDPAGVPLLNPPRNGVPILSVFASPTRAFSSIVDLLVSSTWVNPDTAEAMRTKAEDFGVLPLPVVTVTRQDPTFDPERANIPMVVSDSRDNVSVFQLPMPYWCEYTLSFWGNKVYSENFFKEWVFGQLGDKGNLPNELYISVVHDAPFGTKRHSLQYLGLTDNSDLEGEGPRWKRCEFSFQLRMLLIKPSYVKSTSPL